LWWIVDDDGDAMLDRDAGPRSAHNLRLGRHRFTLQLVRLVSHAGELTLNAFEAGLPVARWYI
jgi:hypothetical protein